MDKARLAKWSDSKPYIGEKSPSVTLHLCLVVFQQPSHTTYVDDDQTVAVFPSASQCKHLNIESCTSRS